MLLVDKTCKAGRNIKFVCEVFEKFGDYENYVIKQTGNNVVSFEI